MKPKLTTLLACPGCGGELKLAAFETVYELDEQQEKVLDIVEGVLTCGCGRAYPIIEGVPRLLEGVLSTQKGYLAKWKTELGDCGATGAEALTPPSQEFSSFIEPTLKRFEKEWAEHHLEEKTWGFDQETRIDQSLRYLGWTKEQVKGKLVLDAGAGTGQLTSSMATLGCEVVGIDLSPAVVRGWRSRSVYAKDRAVHVHIVQGNLLNPPFQKGVFDGIMSQGVLHHTPNTRQAFDALALLVRRRGTLGVWLYKPTEGRVQLVPLSKSRWTAAQTKTLRKVTPKLPPSLLYALLFAYASVFHAFYSVNALVRGRPHKQTVKERVTSLFDTLAPPYVWTHNPQEVCEWFRAQSYIEVRDTSLPVDPEGFCVTGTRG